MAKTKAQTQPTWIDVKAKLAAFDRPGLLGLIHDLYAAHQDNRTFLHTRFHLGAAVLKPYQQTLSRWLWPDVLRGQQPSVAQAKAAVSSYRKAGSDPAGLAELMVFYCEMAIGFYNEVAYDDDSYFNALVDMFEQALDAATQLAPDLRKALCERLERVCDLSLSSGLGDYLKPLLSQYRQA